MMIYGCVFTSSSSIDLCSFVEEIMKILTRFALCAQHLITFPRFLRLIPENCEIKTLIKWSLYAYGYSSLLIFCILILASYLFKVIFLTRQSSYGRWQISQFPKKIFSEKCWKCEKYVKMESERVTMKCHRTSRTWKKVRIRQENTCNWMRNVSYVVEFILTRQFPYMFYLWLV